MSEGTEGISENLGRKIGPLPAGAWAAAILGGLGLGWYLRHRSAAAAADPTVADTTSSGGTPIGTSAAPDSPGSTSNPGNVSGPTSPDLAGDPGASAVSIDTNGQWRQQAVKYVVGAHVATPVNAERAIGGYLAGTPLAVWEVTIVNSAIAGIGPTPSPPPPITLIAPPHPKAPPKHPAHTPPPKHHHAPHSPVAHHTQPTHHHHAHPKPHPHARRDTGTQT